MGVDRRQELIEIGRAHGYRGIYITLRHEKVADTIDRWLPRTGGRRVLNVACGLGLMEHHTTTDVHLVGVDRAEDELEVARQTAARFARPFTYEAGDATTYGEGAPYDMVVASEVIEHLPDDVGFLRHLAGLLTPQGVIVLSAPNRLQPRNALRALVGRELAIMDPTHLREYTRRELEARFDAAGLDVLEASGAVVYFPKEAHVKRWWPAESPWRRALAEAVPDVASHFLYVLAPKGRG